MTLPLTTTNQLAPGKRYVGRFAPSPTGPLHFGSLVAALASYLEARQRAGEWLVRMDDLDTSRVRRGATDQILRALEQSGLLWDGAILYQSKRTGAYQDAFDRLYTAGWIYPCACTRKQAAGRYSGTCAAGLMESAKPRSWRMRVPSEVITSYDRIQGEYKQNLHDTGDFILKRADGPFAYQLAVVVDDAASGITDVVRGADLLDAVPRHIYLQRCLGYRQPEYAHVPVAIDDAGSKLSKSAGSAALDLQNAGLEIWRALYFLGQQPPPELRKASASQMLTWAHEHWSLSRVPRQLYQSQRTPS